MQSEEPRKKRKKPIIEEQQFKAGGVQLTKEELDIVTGRAGGIVTPAIREAEANILRTKARATPQLLTEPQRAEIAAEQAEQRRAGFREAEGSQVLAEELSQQILEPQTLEPTPAEAVGGLGQAGLRVSPLEVDRALANYKLITGKEITAEQFGQTGIGKAMGLIPFAAGAAEAGLGLFLAGGAATTLLAKTAVGAKITGAAGSSTLLRTAVAGLGLFVVGRGVFDAEGGEMDNYRSALKKVVEDGERIEAATRNGFPTGDTIALLRTMADEVSVAERRIKELGITNAQYYVDKEYELDMKNVRSARAALLRRVLAVENIAATGIAADNPSGLLFDLAQLDLDAKVEEFEEIV